jgi:hypothetical protein
MRVWGAARPARRGWLEIRGYDMPALSFKKQFASDVEYGIKCQTIRALRKRPIKTGDMLYLYTGMRTKGCRKLGEAFCRQVRHIRIIEGIDPWTYEIILDGEKLSEIQKYFLAKADGFANADKLFTFFREEHGIPFEGHIYNW